MDRRPLASRSTKWASEAAQFLSKKNISPNDISIMSILFSIFSALFFIKSCDNKAYLLLAALCIQLRLLCNLMDGMVAIEHNKKSIYGNLFNDIPDRFADVFIILGAGYYSQHCESFNAYTMVLGWSNALLAVFSAYIRVLGSSVGTPMFFTGVMAKPQRMALLTVASILALLPRFNIPFLFISLVIMAAGQILTVVKRIKLIANDLKQKSKL